MEIRWPLKKNIPLQNILVLFAGRLLFKRLEDKGVGLAKVRDVAHTTSGGTPSRQVPEYFEGTIPWLKSGELNDGIIYEAEEHITQEALNNSNAKLLPAGTLLVALYGATTGKTGILGLEAATNQAICAIFPSKAVERDYLYWYFRMKREDFLEMSYGGAQPNISQKVINESAIPLPSLGLQKEVVSFLNSLQTKSVSFESTQMSEPLADIPRKVAKVKILMEKIEEMERLRNETARDLEKLLRHVLKEIFETEEFEMSPLNRVCTTANGGTPSRHRSDFFEGKIPWLKSGELNDDLILSAEEHITEEAVKKSAAKTFPKGTLLVALYGATVGKTGILGIDSATNQAICAIFPQDNILDRDYLHWFLKYKRSDFLNRSFGGAQPNISQKLLKETKIPLPQLRIQHEIVNYLVALKETSEKMKELQTATKNEIARLVPSILNDTFFEK